MNEINNSGGKQREVLHLVVKPRKMVTENRYVGEARGTALSLGASKALNMLFSELATMDITLAEKYISVAFRFKEYWRSKGVTRLSGKHIDLNINALKELSEKTVYITLLDPETKRYRQIQTKWVSMIEKIGIEGNETPDTIRVDMPAPLIQIFLADKDVLSTPMEYSIGINSAYAYTAREYFLGLEIYDEPIRMTLEELAELVDAPNYKNFSDFRVNVVEQIVKEINANAKDISVRVEYEKTGRKYTHVIFWVHKTFPELETGIVDQEATLDSDLLSRIRSQIGYDELRSIYGEAADATVLILLSAYRHLEHDGEIFSSKLGFTPAELIAQLDELTQEEVVAGLDSIMEKGTGRRNSELLVLDSILNAATKTAEAPRKDSSRQKNTADRSAAKKEIQDLIGYDLLKHSFSADVTGSELSALALDDLVTAMVTVMTTTNPYTQIGKGNSVLTESARRDIRQYLSQDIAIRTLENYLANYDNIKSKTSRGRQNYLRTCVFNEMQNPAPIDDDID